MKLSSVVLLSVNLVAASQVAANAADTASFLQEALSPAREAAKAQARGNTAGPARPAQHKSKQTKQSYVAMTPVVDGVKMRPFVPGRYLPSEAELKAKKEAENQAKMAAYYAPVRVSAGGESSQMLSGQVSANNDFTSAIIPAATYALSRPANQEYIHKAIQKVKQVAKTYQASRTVPGINPVIPGQVSGSHHVSAARVPEPKVNSVPVAFRVPQPPARPQSMPIEIPQAPEAHVSGTPVVPAPQLSKFEYRQLEKLVDSNMPSNVYSQAFNGDMRSRQGNPGLTGTGPQPFPLSSTNPMMNRGPRMGQTMIGSQARFGSWHGGNPNLQQASFHSFVPVHTAGPMSVKINHYNTTKKTGRQAMPVKSAHQHNSQTAHSSAPQKKALPKKAPFVATYPPYRKYM